MFIESGTTQRGPRRGRRPRRWLFTALASVIILLSLEVGAHVVLAALTHHPRFGFPKVSDQLRGQSERLRKILDGQGRILLELDREIGWVYAADKQFDRYSSNSIAARGQREYAGTLSPDRVRVAAFGDSFVHSNAVADDEAWSARLEELDPRVDALNFGVGGYGIDQALLLARRKLPTVPSDLVILGFAEVDVARNLNRYRPFLSPDDLPLFKPRFRLGPDGELLLIPSPFPDPQSQRPLVDDPTGVLAAAPDDFFFEPLIWRNPAYDRSAFVRLASGLAAGAWRSRLSGNRIYRGGHVNVESEAFALLVALIEHFEREVRAAGREFLFVIFPTRPDEVFGEGTPSYAPLLGALDGRPVLDLAHALARAPGLDARGLLLPDGHYTPAANTVAARAIHGALVERYPVRLARSSPGGSSGTLPEGGAESRHEPAPPESR